MLKSFLRTAYYKLCSQLERFLYRHQTAIYRRDGVKMTRLKNSAKGLHTLLPHDPRYSYSFLIPVHAKTDSLFLKEALEACVDQSANDFEIVIGGAEEAKSKFERIFNEISARFPRFIWVDVPNCPETINEAARLLNELAVHSNGKFLVPLAPEDWIRPDFLLRNEQVLRSLKDPEQHVLYCDEYVIDAQNKTLYFQEIRKPSLFRFPYYFADHLGQGIMLPKRVWDNVKGLKTSVPRGWEIYELTLRLNLAHVTFTHIPLFLYARRSMIKEDPSASPLIELREYFLAHGLDWDVKEGLDKTSLRAIPKSGKGQSIHAIIPYKDQRQMTLGTIAALKRQQGVDIKITAIDNNSKDGSIAQELAAQGVEVLTVNEPFNYSRLNNIAVKESEGRRFLPLPLIFEQRCRT